MKRARFLPFVTVDGGDDVGGSVEESTEDVVSNGDGEDGETAEDTGEAESDFDYEKAMAKIRKANSEAKALRKRAKDAEEKAATADQLKAENERLLVASQRLEVAAEMGIPLPLARRLQGSTREEILADAEELLKLIQRPVKPGKPSRNLVGETVNDSDPKPIDLDELARSFM